MRVISRNYRGLVNPQTIRALKLLIKNHCPHIMFLTETKKMDLDKVFKVILNFGHLTNYHSISFNSNSGGKTGDIALLWNTYDDLNIIDANKNLIDFYIIYINSNNN